MTEADALSAANWVWCAWWTHATVGSGRGWLGVVVADWLAGRNGSVRLDCERSTTYNDTNIHVELITQ